MLKEFVEDVISDMTYVDFLRFQTDYVKKDNSQIWFMGWEDYHNLVENDVDCDKKMNLYDSLTKAPKTKKENALMLDAYSSEADYIKEGLAFLSKIYSCIPSDKGVVTIDSNSKVIVVKFKTVYFIGYYGENIGWTVKFNDDKVLSVDHFDREMGHYQMADNVILFYVHNLKKMTIKAVDDELQIVN